MKHKLGGHNQKEHEHVKTLGLGGTEARTWFQLCSL
jgi:hypothetical protein